MAKKRLVLREGCSGDERSEMRIKKYVAKFGALLATASLAFGTAVVVPGAASAGGTGSHCPKYPIPSSHSKCPGHKGGNGGKGGKGSKGKGSKGSNHHHKKHHHKKHHHKKH
jgi:hypothetical protein